MAEEITAVIEKTKTIGGEAIKTDIRYMSGSDVEALIGPAVDEYVEEHSGGFATKTELGQLNENLSDLDENLSNYGLNSIKVDLSQGYFSGDGTEKTASAWVRTNKIKCNTNDLITVKLPKVMLEIRITFWNSDTFVSAKNVKNNADANFTVPTSVNTFAFSFNDSVNISPDSFVLNGIYINNQIEIIKQMLTSTATLDETE